MPATTEKPPTPAKELAALERMTATELRDKYAALFGEPAASSNRAWLSRRVGWRMQALVEGDLSDRAKAGSGGPHDARPFRPSLPVGGSLARSTHSLVVQ